MIFKNKKGALYKQASKVALDNSQKIFEEAKILYDKEHYARGLALGITSLEESSKAFLFRFVSLVLLNQSNSKRSR